MTIFAGKSYVAARRPGPDPVAADGLNELLVLGASSHSVEGSPQVPDSSPAYGCVCCRYLR
jgi:hypothetical protein